MFEKAANASIYAAVCVLDSPRPGAADHLEDRGRLTEKGQK